MASVAQIWKLSELPSGSQSPSPRFTPPQSCDPRLSHDFPALLHRLSWLAQPRGRLPGSGDLLPTGLLTLCPSPTDRGTIHKVVESGERERSLAFNIMEIQPFHHPAAIQAMSLDAERVSLPTPLYPMELPSDGQLRTELLCM